MGRDNNNNNNNKKKSSSKTKPPQQQPAAAAGSGSTSGGSVSSSSNNNNNNNNNYGKQANLALKNGDVVLAAELYLKAYEVSTRDEGIWATYRYAYFDSFAWNMSTTYCEDGIEVPPKYFKIFEKCIDNKQQNELAIFRSLAAYTCSYIYCHHKTQHNIELSAEYARQAIDICTSSTLAEEELEAEIEYDDGMSSCGEILAETQTKSSSILSALQNRVDADEAEYGNIKIKSGCGAALLRHRFADRLAVGGDKCDCCGKLRSDLRRKERLACCKRCGMSYYCSEECQRKQWKAGHKRACRNSMQIECCDIMILRGLVAKPELNGRLVHVIGPQSDNPDRIKVRVDEGYRRNGCSIISVAKDKLYHIRPDV